jgi:hypothetical protein
MKTKKFLISWFIILTFSLLISPCATSKIAQRSIKWQEIGFELPEIGWERIGDESRLEFHRNEGRNPPYARFQHLAIWPVGVPPALRGLSRQKHASEYFNYERNLTRYEGKWEGFTEGERNILGQLYPTMSFRITFPNSTSVLDGLFLLYFPEDFEVRQRFYVLMWQDFHPANEQATGVDKFDKIVNSFWVRPLNQ